MPETWDIPGPSLLSSPTLKEAVQLGLIPGWGIVDAIGERDGQQQTTLMEDICRFEELSNTPAQPSTKVDYLIPRPAPAGEAMALISESTEDHPGGAGVGSVRVLYVDQNGDEQTVTKVMNGQTAVPLTGLTPQFIQEMGSASLGSGNVTEVADGNIRIYKVADATKVYSMIAAGGNQSLISHRMVPAGKVLLMQWWTPSESQGKRSWIRLRVDSDSSGARQAGVYLFKSSVCVNNTTPGPLPLAHRIPELCVIKASTLADTVGADTSVHWWGYIVDA